MTKHTCGKACADRGRCWITDRAVYRGINGRVLQTEPLTRQGASSARPRTVHHARYAFVPDCGARWSKRSRIADDVTLVTCPKCLAQHTLVRGRWMSIREFQALVRAEKETPCA